MKWPDEIRVPAFDELDIAVEVTDQEVEMAQSLIDHLSDDFDPPAFHESCRERLEGISSKIEGGAVHLAPEAEQEPESLTDLLEALQASVAATRRSA